MTGFYRFTTDHRHLQTMRTALLHEIERVVAVQSSRSGGSMTNAFYCQELKEIKAAIDAAVVEPGPLLELEPIRPQGSATPQAYKVEETEKPSKGWILSAVFAPAIRENRNVIPKELRSLVEALRSRAHFTSSIPEAAARLIVEEVDRYYPLNQGNRMKELTFDEAPGPHGHKVVRPFKLAGCYASRVATERTHFAIDNANKCWSDRGFAEPLRPITEAELLADLDVNGHDADAEKVREALGYAMPEAAWMKQARLAGWNPPQK